MAIDHFIEQDRIAHDGSVDRVKLDAFRKEHDRCLPARPSLDPIFFRDYAVQYQPSNCGNCVTLICPCGAKEDITDYSQW